MGCFQRGLAIISLMVIGGQAGFAYGQTAPQLPQDITLNQAIAYSLATNPQLQSYSRNIDLATKDIDIARAGYRPSLSANGGISHFQNKAGSSNNWQGNTNKTLSLDVEQSLYSGGQTDAAVNKQEFFKAATENQFTQDTQALVLQVVQDYMATYHAVESMRVNAENVILLTEQYKATKARFDAGELTRTDVAMAEAQLAQAKALDAESIAVYETALAGFQGVTGLQTIPDLIYPILGNTHLPSSLEEAITIGMDRNPLIIKAQAQVNAQSENIAQASGAFLPQVSAGGSVGYERDPVGIQYSSQQSAVVSVNATLPIYQGGVLQNRLDQSKILKFQAEDDLEQVKRDVRENIIAAWNVYKTILVQIVARDSQLQASKIAFEGVKLEEEVGARSILDVLDANQKMLDAELALIDVQRDRVNMYYQLLLAIGQLNQSVWDNSDNSL